MDLWWAWPCVVAYSEVALGLVFRQLVCWWVGMYPCPVVSCSAWGTKELAPADYWVLLLLGGARCWQKWSKLSAASISSVHVGDTIYLTPYMSPIYLTPVSMSPRWAAVAPDSPGDSPRPTGRSGLGSYQIIAFALCPSASEILCTFFNTLLIGEFL